MPTWPLYSIKTPSTPSIDKALLMPAWIPSSASSPLTTFPTAVAAASAKVAFLQKTVAASASPKLSAWLKRPELVATPIGNSVNLKPKRLESGSSPAATATSTGWFESAYDFAAVLHHCHLAACSFHVLRRLGQLWLLQLPPWVQHPLSVRLPPSFWQQAASQVQE